MNKFADRLREIMRSYKMTQAELAKLIEVSPGTLSSYLKDDNTRKYPALDTLERISAKLSVPIGWLCGEDQINESNKTYADLFRMIFSLVDTEMFSPFQIIVYHESDEYSQPVGVSISTYEQTLVDFLSGLDKVFTLYSDGTIDREMLEAWVEKRVRQEEKHIINPQSF